MQLIHTTLGFPPESEDSWLQAEVSTSLTYGRYIVDVHGMDDRPPSVAFTNFDAAFSAHWLAVQDARATIFHLFDAYPDETTHYATNH